MITRRSLIWLIPACLIITYPLWKIPIISFLTPPGTYDTSLTEKRKLQHSFKMGKVTITQSEKGKQTAHIVASKAFSAKKPFTFTLENIVADIVSDSGSVTKITANSGTYYQKEERIRLQGDVVIDNRAEKYTMQTDLLFYNGSTRFIRSPRPTCLKGDGITIEGSAFSHDMKNSTYQVEGRVHSTIAADKTL